MKKTKILATFGPSISSVSKLRQLVAEGVDAFRINCSHGSTEDLVRAVKLIRKATDGHQYPVGLLFDISGPKLRLDRFTGEFSIKAGERMTLTTGKSQIEKRIVAVNHKGIISSLRKGERFFIDDGAIRFEVAQTDGQRAVIKAINSGLVLPGKGINLPDSQVQIPTISAKDKQDIATAVEYNADFIALSFVRSGDDIIEARRIIKRLNGKQRIIAKLEKREALNNLEEIMLFSDGVMIARGDLGVELPFEELPRLQTQIIQLARRHHKPVIVATQMLESMRFSPRPTRAEVTDVAGAVKEFVDVVMLSAETASGQYPVEAVQTMTKVIEATEAISDPPQPEMDQLVLGSAIPIAIADAVSHSHLSCPTKLIFAFTTSGFTAQMISNLYPPQPVVALTTDKNVMGRLSLYRSVYSVHIKQPGAFDDMVRIVETVGRKRRLAQSGDRVIVTGGVPFGSTAPTNFMMIYELGEL